MGASDAGLLLWKCYELARRHEDGTADERCTRPFSEALATGGTLPTTAINKMRRLVAHGWPAARREMVDDRGKRIIVRPDSKNPSIWELKGKPSCWRLYFHVYEEEEKCWFVFLLAICKKKWKANNQGDAAKARRLLLELGPGGSCALIEFEFPARENIS